jgi:hypothetical protein
MDSSYIKINSFFDREIKQNRFVTASNTISFNVDTPEFNEFAQILCDNQTKLRGKDGVPMRVTISIPTSKENIFVLGIRYRKKDNTYAEDTFTVEIDKSPEPYYKGRIEKSLPEYKDTHKRQNDY